MGGEENISLLTHCATRLRMNLKDNSKANVDALKNLDGVITAQMKSGQLQVVIGAKVNAIFDEVSAQVHITEDGGEIQEPQKNKVGAAFDACLALKDKKMKSVAGSPCRSIQSLCRR